MRPRVSLCGSGVDLWKMNTTQGKGNHTRCHLMGIHPAENFQNVIHDMRWYICVKPYHVSEDRDGGRRSLYQYSKFFLPSPPSRASVLGSTQHFCTPGISAAIPRKARKRVFEGHDDCPPGRSTMDGSVQICERGSRVRAFEGGYY